MSRTLRPVLSLLAAALAFGALLPAASAQELATWDTAAALLPPGDYECKMDSYAFRPCTVEAAGRGVTLHIPKWIGHFFSMRAELMPSDEKGEIMVLGRFIDTENISYNVCAADAPESNDCIGTPTDRIGFKEQLLMSRMKRSGDQWRGQLYYHTLRPSYDFGGGGATYLGCFKVSERADFVIRPAKKKS